MQKCYNGGLRLVFEHPVRLILGLNSMDSSMALFSRFCLNFIKTGLLSIYLSEYPSVYLLHTFCPVFAIWHRYPALRQQWLLLSSRKEQTLFCMFQWERQLIFFHWLSERSLCSQHIVPSIFTGHALSSKFCGNRFNCFRINSECETDK